MTATVHTQDVSVSPFTLSQTDQIPFLFSAIPYQLIDDEVFGDLKGSHVKLILAIDRFRNLKLKQRKSDQVLLSGWTIAISQQVREMKSRKVEGIIHDEEMQRMKQEIEELKQRIDYVVEVEQDSSDETCQEIEQTYKR